MPFITLSKELSEKSFINIEKKFITKYLSVLDDLCIRTYLYCLLFAQSNNQNNVEQLLTLLKVQEDELLEILNLLEEYGLIDILSYPPLNICINNLDGTTNFPKKYKAEKYADFTKSAQAILSERMISPNEYFEYYYLIEECGFDKDALLMIISYCASLKGKKVGVKYIKTVALSFANEGYISIDSVEQKLKSFGDSSKNILKIFSAIGCKRHPDLNDTDLYKKWHNEFGFDDEAIIFVAKAFNVKNFERLDVYLIELYEMKKFDVLEIKEYCANKNQIKALTIDISKNLGIYVQNTTPYIKNYIDKWLTFGYDYNTIITISNFCFLNNRKSFEAMDELILTLYNDGLVTPQSIDNYIGTLKQQDAEIKQILTACGIERKVIPSDRICYSNWINWSFSLDMILQAASLALGKSNPIAYINSILSSWKTQGITNVDYIKNDKMKPTNKKIPDAGIIERHYADLRHVAEDKAHNLNQRALSDSIYKNLTSQLNELSIKIAFAEIRDKQLAANLQSQANQLEVLIDKRLLELNIDKSQLTPQYLCKKCNDTGYDTNGKQCACLIEFINNFNN